MVRQQTRQRRNARPLRQMRVRALCLLSAMTLMVGGATAHRFAASRNSPRNIGNVRTLTPIRYVTQQTKLIDLPTFPVLVTVDAQAASETEHLSLAEMLHDLIPASDSQPGAPANDAALPLPAWVSWAHLDAKRAHVQLSASTTAGAEPLGVYATRGEWGTSLCLVNKSNARLLTTAQLRLPRGVYTLERLTIGTEDRRGEEKKRRRGDRERKQGRTAIVDPTTQHPFPLTRL